MEGKCTFNFAFCEKLINTTAADCAKLYTLLQKENHRLQDMDRRCTKLHDEILELKNQIAADYQCTVELPSHFTESDKTLVLNLNGLNLKLTPSDAIQNTSEDSHLRPDQNKETDVSTAQIVDEILAEQLEKLNIKSPVCKDFQGQCNEANMPDKSLSKSIGNISDGKLNKHFPIKNTSACTSRRMEPFWRARYSKYFAQSGEKAKGLNKLPQKLNALGRLKRSMEKNESVKSSLVDTLNNWKETNQLDEKDLVNQKPTTATNNECEFEYVNKNEIDKLFIPLEKQTEAKVIEDDAMEEHLPIDMTDKNASITSELYYSIQENKDDSHISSMEFFDCVQSPRKQSH